MTLRLIQTNAGIASIAISATKQRKTMFTHKDIENRTIFVINCIKDRSLRVSNGELLLEEWVEDADKYKTLTKMPFQKMLALFVVGHISVTTPLNCSPLSRLTSTSTLAGFAPNSELMYRLPVATKPSVVSLDIPVSLFFV